MHITADSSGMTTQVPTVDTYNCTFQIVQKKVNKLARGNATVDNLPRAPTKPGSHCRAINVKNWANFLVSSTRMRVGGRAKNATKRKIIS